MPAVATTVEDWNMDGRPKRYRLTGIQRGVNAVYTLLTRCGLGAGHRHLLTVVGRRSGIPRTTPVDVMTHAGSRWLVAPYGEVDWVRNLRASGTATLQRGRYRDAFVAEEVDAPTAVPVIRRYIADVRVTRPYWGVGTDATDAQLEQEAVHHPVFRLTESEFT